MNPFPGRLSVLILDNASIHYSAAALAMLVGAGIRFIFLPAYSPQLNAIELAFGIIKRF